MYCRRITHHSVRVLDDPRDLPLRVLTEVPVGQVLEMSHVAGRGAALARDVHIAVVVHPQLAHDYVVHCRCHLEAGREFRPCLYHCDAAK